MIVLLLVITMFQQEIPFSPEGGTIKGIIRTTAGDPAPKVRVAAALCSDVSSSSIILVRLTETDNSGRFILEDVPPGRYCLLAGAIERPTFYPGTLDSTRETIVTLGPGAILTDIDFAIDNSSNRPKVPTSSSPQPIRIDVPIRVTVEGEDNLPDSANLQSAIIRLTSTKTGIVTEVPLSDKSIQLPVKTDETEDYQVRVERLSQEFTVKSLTFNDTDLKTSPLKASVEFLLPTKVPLQIVTFGGPGQSQTIVDRAMQHLSGFKGLSVVLARSSN